MGKKFIYVFNLEARDKLLAENYRMLKCDERQNIFIFENKENCNFAAIGVSYILSDTLSF